MVVFQSHTAAASTAVTAITPHPHFHPILQHRGAGTDAYVLQLGHIEGDLEGEVDHRGDALVGFQVKKHAVLRAGAM